MPTRVEVAARLFEATPSGALLPLVRTGFAGKRVAASAATLREQLAEPHLLRPAGTSPLMTMNAIGDLARAVIDLSRAEPAARDVVVNLFGNNPDPTVEALQADFLDACFLGVMALAADRITVDDHLNDIIRTAASVTSAGWLLRDLLADPSRPRFPLEIPRGGVGGLPPILVSLLVTAEGLRRRGCANAVRLALQRWGTAVAEHTPSYSGGVIERLEPTDGCPGEEMVIHGHGFGSGAQAAVAFTGANGRAVLCTRRQIREWTDVAVTVTIPDGARRGPVGIVVFFVAGGQTLADAASTAIGELGDCFGPGAILPLLDAAQKISPPLFPPPATADGANQFTGGPPSIDVFTVDPGSSGPLWPGRRIGLSWLVTGADSVEIVARDVAGSPAQELPAVPGPLASRQGSVQVTVPGHRSWNGEYVLRARNRCTPGAVDVPERALRFEMGVRRGLALGGGGTRGDFQVGALIYLYDEKGYRPDAIAGTSVGAINAVDLITGDDAAVPATPTTPAIPARSAASRLASTWLGLNGDPDMWAEEPWLATAKLGVRSFLRMLSGPLLLFPVPMLAAGMGVDTLIELKRLSDNPRKYGIQALFNLGPIETRARAQYSQARADAAGIRLRLVSTSLENAEPVMVDESGGVLLRGEQPIRPATVPAATPTDVIDGAIAAASMPGITPARRLGDHVCVDGGVRDVVPVQVAVQEMGCNEVIALRCSAPPELLPTDPQRTFFEVAARAVLEITFDEVADDDVAPFGGWGQGVSVLTIEPSFNLHDVMVVDPGLIRIAIDYGWMRAADMLDAAPEHRRFAMELSDAITALRAQNWGFALNANGYSTPNAHRDFAVLLASGSKLPEFPQVQIVRTPEAIDAIRDNCRRIRDHLAQRLSIGVPTPPATIRTAWFTQWEHISPVPFGTPWDPFSSTAPNGDRPGETPPDPI